MDIAGNRRMLDDVAPWPEPEKVHLCPRRLHEILNKLQLQNTTTETNYKKKTELKYLNIWTEYLKWKNI